MLSMRVVRKTHRRLPKSLSGPSKVDVGFPSGAVDLMDIKKAFWNEFGTRGGASRGGWGGPVPERPFMRNAIRDNAGKYKAELKSSGAAILKGSASLRAALAGLGEGAKSDIQGEITALMSPPNSAATISLKGFNDPLIETGKMRAAVTYKVKG